MQKPERKIWTAGLLYGETYICGVLSVRGMEIDISRSEVDRICMTQMIMIQMTVVLAMPLKVMFPKQVVKSSSLSSADNWLELAMEEDEETILKRVEAKIAASSSTSFKRYSPPG